MATQAVTPPYKLAPDEKVTQVMAYTQNNLYWGDLVSKEIIRVSTWLRTNTAPERVTIFNAKSVLITNPNPQKPILIREMNVALSQILAFHIMPPGKDPLDYDPTEPNRKMEPVTLLVSTFRIEGCLRLSTRSSMAKFLEVTRENFTGVYDAKINNTLISSMGTITVPFLLVRQETTIFTHA